MANTSARMLRLLLLLQTHRYWPETELADRLEVSPRSVALRPHQARRRERSGWSSPTGSLCWGGGGTSSPGTSSGTTGGASAWTG